MGLDMWLNVRTSLRDWEFEEPEKRQTKEVSTVLEMIGFSRDDIDQPTIYVEVPVIYWRKANAVHGWFITNCTDGTDECQPIRVSRETLEHLRNDAMRVLSLRGDIQGVEEAECYLPPTPGFFFGSTEINEHYYNDLQYTVEEITKVLNKVPVNDWYTSFIYQASW